MKEIKDFYNCLLVRSKAPPMLIRKINALQHYDNPALSTCRLIAGNIHRNDEIEAFAVTYCEYLCDKHNLNLNEQEFTVLASNVFRVFKEMEDKITKNKKKK